MRVYEIWDERESKPGKGEYVEIVDGNIYQDWGVVMGTRKGKHTVEVFLAGVPPPWTKTEAHNCEAMVHKLSKDPRFDLTWQRDGDLKTSRDLWKAFQVNDGDIAIWSNRYLTHTGILERADNNEKNIYYAGSSNEAGANYTDADYFVGSNTKGYGPPDYVFRYRGFRHQD